MLTPLLLLALPAAVYSDMLGVWGDKMVLQHDSPQVHGCFPGASAPSHVVVEVARTAPSVSSNTTVNVDPSGCFVANLPPVDIMREGSHAATISVRIGDTVHAQATGVLFGVVVVCSGQVRVCVWCSLRTASTILFWR